MIKKVAFICSLFLLVDRVMYYKLGQSAAHKENHALSAHVRPLRHLVRKERHMRQRIAFFARELFHVKKMNSHIA